MDPISLLVGGGLLVTGYLAGRRRRRTRTALPAVPMCACGHGMSYHDAQTGQCHAEAGRTNKRYDPAYGTTLLSYDPVACTCRRYVGPEHIADVWAPPPAIGEFGPGHLPSNE